MYYYSVICVNRKTDNRYEKGILKETQFGKVNTKKQLVTGNWENAFKIKNGIPFLSITFVFSKKHNNQK